MAGVGSSLLVYNYGAMLYVWYVKRVRLSLADDGAEVEMKGTTVGVAGLGKERRESKSTKRKDLALVAATVFPGEIWKFCWQATSWGVERVERGRE